MPHTRTHLLLVEDEPAMAVLIRAYLATADLNVVVEHVGQLSDGLQRLNDNHADLVLLDLMLPDSIGLDTFRQVHAFSPTVPIVVMTGLDAEEMAVQAVHEGAQDYLFKGDMNEQALVRAVHYAIERSRRQRAEAQLLANQRELEIARHIQQELYPTGSPVLPGYDVAGLSIPAESVGGDYFDYLSLVDGTEALAIGDASGHGIGPALMMAETRACLRTLARRETDLEAILTQAHELLIEGTLEANYVTLLLAKLDPKTGTFSYASAGHPPGFIFNAHGPIRETLTSTCPPLGIICDRPGAFRRTLHLEPDDLVVLLSDGVREAGISYGEPFGDQGVINIVQQHRGEPAARIVELILQAAQSHCTPHRPGDDMTAMVIHAHRLPKNPPHRAKLHARTTGATIASAPTQP